MSLQYQGVTGQRNVTRLAPSPLPKQPLKKVNFHVVVLLSITFSARRDELWGRFLGVPSGSGGLSIRLPPLDAPSAAVENRQHRLRLAAMWGRLAIWGRVAIGLLRGPSANNVTVAFKDLP
jgi:hypothetical protein